MEGPSMAARPWLWCQAGTDALWAGEGYRGPHSSRLSGLGQKLGAPGTQGPCARRQVDSTETAPGGSTQHAALTVLPFPTPRLARNVCQGSRQPRAQCGVWGLPAAWCPTSDVPLLPLRASTLPHQGPVHHPLPLKVRARGAMVAKGAALTSGESGP